MVTNTPFIFSNISFFKKYYTYKSLPSLDISKYLCTVERAESYPWIIEKKFLYLYCRT